MKDERLRQLNFSQLINYRDGQPEPCNIYPQEFLRDSATIGSFCKKCHEGADPPCGEGYDLTFTTHGADQSDFESETVLGPLAPERPFYNTPVAFVFEGPGDEPQIRHGMSFDGVKRLRPAGYYWMPEKGRWPESPSDQRLAADRYGPPLAYYIWLFGLRNAYVTNAVKCQMRAPGQTIGYGLSGKNGPGPTVRVEKTCIDEFLKHELSLAKPKIVFAFGKSVFKLLRWHIPREERLFKLVCLVHPSPRVGQHHPGLYPTITAIVQENAKRICATLGCTVCETAKTYPKTDGYTRWQTRCFQVKFEWEEPFCECSRPFEGGIPHQWRASMVLACDDLRVLDHKVKQQFHEWHPQGKKFRILRRNKISEAEASLAMEAEATGLTDAEEVPVSLLTEIERRGRLAELKSILAEGCTSDTGTEAVLRTIDCYGFQGHRLIEAAAILVIEGAANRRLLSQLRRFGAEFV